MADGEADRHYPIFSLRPPQAGSHTRADFVRVTWKVLLEDFYNTLSDYPGQSDLG